jgi:hypothetical protein
MLQTFLMLCHLHHGCHDMHVTHFYQSGSTYYIEINFGIIHYIIEIKIHSFVFEVCGNHIF